MSRKGGRKSNNRPRNNIQKRTASSGTRKNTNSGRRTSGTKSDKRVAKVDGVTIEPVVRGRIKASDVPKSARISVGDSAKSNKSRNKSVSSGSGVAHRRAYKAHILGSRSSNARNLSDDELKSISRIPKRERVIRLVNGFDDSTGNVLRFESVERETKQTRKTVKRQKFKPKELLELFFKNKEFRDVFLQGWYVCVDGFICVCSDECLEIIDNQLHIKKDIKSQISQYCVSVSYLYEIKSDGSRGSLLSTHVKPAAKQSISKDISLMRLFMDTDGPDQYYTYGEALSDYMNVRGYNDDDMEDLTYISSKSFERYRKDENRPGLPYSVAICIALELFPDQSFEMIRLSKNILDFTTEEGRAYRFLILSAAFVKYSVQECNELLINEGLKALTTEK